MTGFRYAAVFLLLLLLAFPCCASGVSEEVVPPAWPVPDYVQKLLDVASAEVGYTEEWGRTKYGEWAGDPYCQWCAEFQCWCVDQVDKRFGTSLLRNIYPLYTSSNTGRSWFIRAGRYAVRKGPVEGWGYEWLKDADSYLSSGDYVPQPGDWVFFNWTGGPDTQHVAMVEYCTRNTLSGEISIHVIEGNNPSAVARNTYPLNDGHILGYGTVHDAVDITMSFGNQGEKVRQLQEKLSYLGYLAPEQVNGRFGDATSEAVRAYQLAHGLRANCIANRVTQQQLNREYTQKSDSDPALWTVVDDE